MVEQFKIVKRTDGWWATVRGATLILLFKPDLSAVFIPHAATWA